MNSFSRIAAVSGTAVAAILVNSANSNGQSLTERAHSAAMTVISATDDKPTDRQLWAMQRPVSFSHLGAETTAPLMDLLGQALSPALISAGCFKEYFEAFAELAENQPEEMTDQIAELEQAYIDEVGLTADQLATYKEYKAKYEAELKRLSELSKNKAEAEAYLLRQIETDWEIFGYRHEFATFEDRVAELLAGVSKIDTDKLKEAVLTADGTPRFNLSVPVEQWLKFDSWIYHRRSGGAAAAVPEVRTVELADSDLFNTGSCQPGSCSRELEKGTFAGNFVALEILAPRIELPWLTKFRVAAASLPEPIKGCELSTVPDRLILMRGVNTGYAEAWVETLAAALERSKPFDVDGVQFSGKPDIGMNYLSSPMFMNAGIVSPFSFILGFTSQKLPESDG